MPSSLTPEQRSLRARQAVLESWANTSDPSARTKPGRDAAFAKFERQVDPDGVLPAAERKRRAEAARRAHMQRLAYRSSRARQRPQAGDAG